MQLEYHLKKKFVEESFKVSTKWNEMDLPNGMKNVIILDNNVGGNVKT